MTHILERDGVKVVTAQDGHQAMQRISFASPDAVLLDVRLPGLSGMEVLKKIRETDDDLPVVFITAYADIRQAVEAMKDGAYDYLSKPFDNNEVLRVVRRALSEGQLKKRLKTLTVSPLGIVGLIENMGPSDTVARLVLRCTNTATYLCPQDSVLSEHSRPRAARAIVAVIASRST